MLYFDSAAAARPPRAVLDFYSAALEEEFANQEAAHALGYASRKRLADAERELAFALTGSEKWHVVWGNSGTSIFRLLADSPRVRNRPVVTSLLEHPALTANVRRTASAVHALRPDRGTGKLEIPEAELRAFRPDTVLLHHVQSELGVIQPFDALTESLRSRFGGRLFTAADAIQSAAKLDLPETADALVVSGHKFGSPGGAALLIRADSPFAREMLDHARRCRSEAYLCARPEPALMRTLAFAARFRSERRTDDLRHVTELNAALRRQLRDLPLPGGGTLRETIAPEDASPYLLHCLLPGVDTGVLVRMLSERGVMAAAGSACAAESKRPSPALAALGVGAKLGHSGLRIGLSRENSADEIKILAATLIDVLKNY